MKCIRFAAEIMVISESVTFWIQNRGSDYSCPYCVNMSFLESQNFMGEPSLDTIIRSEGYETGKEARSRLNELFKLLSDPPVSDNSDNSDMMAGVI